VGAELGAEAVAPGDPRAAQASGTVQVSVDRAAHTLSVAYRGQAEPITRTVDLPADAEATERAAVLLAGNLARDEAGELAAALRRARPAAPPRVEDTVPDAVERAELDRLGATLGFDARWSAPRRTLADVTLGVGFGAVAASATVSIYGAATGARWSSDAAFYLLQGGNALVIGSYLLRPGDFGPLTEQFARERAEGLPPAVIVDDVERAWFRAVRTEQNNRRVIGWVTIVAGSVVAGLSGAALAVYAAQPSPGGSFSIGSWSGWTAVGAFDLTVGIDLVVTPGPLESALRTYQTAAGRRTATDTARLLPFVAPAHGGGVAGLGGRF
jgi:hypothetical protein